MTDYNKVVTSAMMKTIHKLRQENVELKEKLETLKKKYRKQNEYANASD